MTFARDGRARELAAALPAAATQLGAVVHAGEVWLFGGTDFRPEAGGGEATCSRAVLALDPTAAAPTFRDTGVELPARRRSFGLARLDGKVCLIGGLGDGFEPVRQGDVFEFATRTWSRMPEPPRAWVSPQTAVLGNTVYVACGGTMSGRRFTSDQAVWAFDESNGWRAIAELPFATRHVQMLALRDRLLFVDMTTPGALTLRTWRPAGA